MSMSEQSLFYEFKNGNSVRIWPSGEIIFVNKTRCTRTQITSRGEVFEVMDYSAVAVAHERRKVQARALAKSVQTLGGANERPTRVQTFRAATYRRRHHRAAHAKKGSASRLRNDFSFRDDGSRVRGSRVVAPLKFHAGAGF
jgi:hypothetical protein